MKEFDAELLKQYAKDFDESKMWNKIKCFFVEAGINLVIKVLQLWYVLQEPYVPAHVKVMIMGAIAYFVIPFDFIIDVLPGGYHDDLLAVIAAISVTEEYIDDEIRRKAREKVMEIIEEIEQTA